MTSKKERGTLDFPRIVLVILILIVSVAMIYFLFLSEKENENTEIYSEHVQKEVIEALVTSLKLYQVHEIPYLGTTPKIQIYIKEDLYFVNSYYLEIISGQVMIKDGETEEEDIIIRTTREEVEQIVNSPSYIKESISSGRTTVEKATSDFILFTKGYPDIFIEK